MTLHYGHTYIMVAQLFADSVEQGTVLYFFAWLKRFYTAVLERRVNKGMRFC